MKRTTLDKLNYEAFFQVASYMFCIASEDGYFLEVNDAFTEVLGYSKNELISKPFVDFIHPDDISSTKEELGRLVSGGKSINFRNRYLAKDGSYKVLEWNTRPIGPDHMLYAIARDITPQIHNFQDLQEKYTKSKDEVNHSNNRIRSLYDHAPDMMGSVDPPSGKFIHVNHKMQEKTGYARTELFGMTWPKVLSSASKRKVGHLIQQFNETGRIINEKVIIQTKNGLHFPVELNTQAVKDGQGKVLYTTFVLRDISLRETNRINYERTNKRLQKIAELSPSIIYLFDIKKQKNIFSNRQLHEKLGYSDQDVSEQGEAFLPSIIHPDDWSKVIQHIGDKLPNLSDGEVAMISYRMRRKDTHEYIWLQSVETVFERDEHGSVSVILGYATDITVHHDRQIQLDLVSKRFSKVSQLSPSLFYILDLQSRELQFVNESVEKQLGFTPSEIIDMGNMAFANMLHPEDLPTALHYQQNVSPNLKDGELFTYDCRIRKKAPGEYIWVQATFTAYDRFPDGRVKSTMGILTDITDRKQKEKELAETTQRLEKIANLSPSIIYLYDVENQRNAYTNHSVFEQLGYTSEEIKSMGSQLLNKVIHPDDVESLARHFSIEATKLKDGEIIFNEHRILNKRSNQYEWYRTRDNVFERHPDGTVKTLIGIASNINEEKMANERLLQQTQTISLGEDVANLSSWVLNVENHQLYTTPQFEKMLGFERNSINPENALSKWTEHVHPYDLERVKTVTGNLRNMDLPFIEDYRYILPSGKTIWVRVNVGLWLEKNRIMGTIQDVTATKNYELQLKEQNDMIRLGEEVSNLCSWVFNTTSKTVEFTPRFEKIHGFQRGSLTPETAMEKVLGQVHPGDMAIFTETLENITELSLPFSLEYRLKLPSKRIIWIRDTIGVWLDEERIMGTTQDITKQKEKDLELARQYQRSSLGEVVANMSSMVIDFKNQRTEISPQFIKMFGFDPKMVNPENAMEVYTNHIHPEDRPLVLHMIGEIVSKKQTLPTTLEYRFMHPEGHVMWIKGTIGMWLDGHTVVGTSQDITYLKDNELVLKKQNQTNELAEEVAKMCSWVVDVNTMEAEISSRFLEMFGLDPEFCTPSNVMTNWMANVHPDDQETVQAEVTGILSQQIPIPRTKEYRYVLPSGENMWVRCTFGVWLDETKIVGSTIDITEEKEQDLQLKALNRQVERQKELLLHGEEVSKIGTWTWNKLTNRYSYSEGLHHVFHLEPNVFSAENVISMIKSLVHPDDLDKVRIFHQAARDNILPSGSELVYRVITPKEQIVWIQFTVGGWVEHQELIGVCRDITTAKIAEEKLLNTQQELEQLVYSVSHDLRAPVRHVEAFASKIFQKDEANLSDSGIQYLERVQMAAVQLGSKIDDLLAYSRSRTDKLNIQQIDLNQLIDPLVQNFKDANTDQIIEWQIDPLPVIHADQNLIEAAFQNLIGNAIKYSSKKPISCIAIKAKKLPGFWQFEVHDNGAGFDMQYAAKLFQPFQRLHTQREFIGNGIGLANVHRIVTRHKGKIWATGKVEEGAAFFFTLPVS